MEKRKFITPFSFCDTIQHLVWRHKIFKLLLKSLSTFIKILTFFYVFVVVVEAGGCCAVVFVVVVVEVAEFEFVVDFVFSFEKRYGRQPLGSGSGTKSRSRS